MDVYLHTFLAVGCIAVAYYAGRHCTKLSVFEEVVENTLESLESGGYIRSKLDKDGDKELITIKEIRKKET